MKRIDRERPWMERVADVRAQLDEWRAVRALVRRFGVRGADVDDVAQEVATVLHRKTCAELTHDPEKEGAPPAIERRALVWGIAQRIARKHRCRSAASRRAMEAAAQLMVASPEPTPEEHVIAGESSARVERALVEIQAAQPALYEVFARHLGGEAMSTIAKALGVPEGTAHTRLRRARAHFDATVRRQAAEQKGRAQRARLKTGARSRWS